MKRGRKRKPVEETFVGDEIAATEFDAAIVYDDDDDAANEKNNNVDLAYGVRPFYWKAKHLFPFAIDREGDFLRHREMIGDAPLVEVIGNPQAMLPDALRVLWFCSHDPAEWLLIPAMVNDGGTWRKRTAQERALEVEQKVRQWAQANITRDEGPLAVSVFYDIYQSAQSTRATVKPSNRHDEEREKN